MCHVTDIHLHSRARAQVSSNPWTPVPDLAMSPPDLHSPTPSPTTPPRPRSSNRTLLSPLRPNSAPGSPRPTITPTMSSRPAIGSASSPATPPPERSKTRAMDLLRKHYGLSVTPPTPSGRPMDPMDLGQRPSRNIPRLL